MQCVGKGRATLIAILASASLAAATLRADERDAVHIRAAAFVDAYRSGSTIAMRALWEPSPAATRFLGAFDRLRQVRYVSVPRAEIGAIELQEGSASVPLELDVGEEAMHAGDASRFSTRRAVLRLAKKNDSWAVTAYQSEEERLAAELSEKRTSVAALLATNPEWITPELDRALAALSLREVNRGNKATSAEIITTAADVAGACGDRAGLALTIGIRAALAGLDGRLDVFAAETERAIALAETGGDPDVLARLINYRGRPLERAGDVAGAREWFDRALALAPRIPDPLTINALLSSVAKVELAQSDLRAALRHYQTLLRSATEQGDETTAVAAEMAIGATYEQENDLELAALYMERAAARAAAIHNQQFLARSLMSLAPVYESSGRAADATRVRDQALGIARSIDDVLGVAEALRYRALAHLDRGEFAAATSDLEESLALLEKNGRSNFTPSGLLLMAWTKVEEGKDLRGAAEYAGRCAATSLRLGDPEASIECRKAAGKAFRILGEDDAALDAYMQAIAESERMRSLVPAEARQRVLSFAGRVDAYTEAVSLLVRRGRLEEAFALAERAKARALLDILTSRGSLPSGTLTAAERGREAELERASAKLHAQLASERAAQRPDAKAVETLAARADAARADREAFRSTLYARHARLRAERGDVELVRASDLGALLRCPSCSAIEYVVSERNTLVFIVTRNGAGKPRLRAHVLGVGQAELARRVTRFRTLLVQRDLRAPEAAKALAGTLLGPAMHELAGTRVLCIVPDGPLWQLPFEALSMPDGRYLVEHFASFYAPSLSVLREVMAPRASAPAPGTLLAVGNPAVSRGNGALPPLPEAEREVRALADLYGSSAKVLIGRRATESAVKAELPRYRILHLATHARLVDANPMYSSLILAGGGGQADDGMLEAWELLDADLHSDLAVLSACETARGRFRVGEGVIGMTWALFAAGCPSSVVSDWTVSSAGTSELMLVFHRGLLRRQGTPFAKAKALRDAKMRLLRSDRFAHPFYWSAFVLIGAP